jgi:hypothetical protein
MTQKPCYSVDIWRDFKSVAHLWAAFHLLKQEKILPEWSGLGSPDGFVTFLAYAEFMRHFGVTYVAAPSHR